MIDEKKIDKAGRDYVNNKGWFNKLNPDYCTDVEIAFEEGAHWAIQEFLKDLWHSDEEAPRKNEKCLVEVNYCINHGLQPNETRIEESSFHDFGWYDCYFKYLSRDYDIVRWLYIDDLFPKQKGGE